MIENSERLLTPSTRATRNHSLHFSPTTQSGWTEIRGSLSVPRPLAAPETARDTRAASVGAASEFRVLVVGSARGD